MQKQRIIILIAGLITALICFILIMSFMNQQVQQNRAEERRRVEQQLANQVAVLVAKQDIPKGTAIDASMLDTAIVPGQYVQPQAVTSLDRIAGMMAIAPIAKGEQLTLGKLTSPREAAAGGGSLAMATPAGKRAITISVDTISSVAGMIKPGDYVDVIATLPVPVQNQEGKQTAQPVVMPLFQNVLILAVGQTTTSVAPPDEEGRYKKSEAVTREASPLITLALTPQEANLLSFIYDQNQQKVRLTLRSPTDAKIEQVQPATWETLFQYLMPNAMQAKPKDEVKPKEQLENTSEANPTEYIEIYRGLNKEKIPLSK